jgi:probable rRNA maturation factor
MLSLALQNRQKAVRVDKRSIRKVVRRILEDAGIESAEISIAIVDDAAIAKVHGEFLDDDSPTDVISFVLDASPGRLEGEVVASAETATLRAPEYDQSAEEELFLYVVHGLLHLVGYDDTTPKARKVMRAMERKYSSEGSGCRKQ